MRKSRSADFEKSLQELEQLVEKLEHGELPLDEAMKTYERGFSLARECQTALQQAQARVEILNREQPAVAGDDATDRDADADVEPFEADDDDASRG
jgi:exodeoxyribonuclease VII small subunit